jgi:anti-sigma regulatory factor (Ser/Thr protein kinase)
VGETSVLPANHTILLYGREDEFLAAVAPFVQGGVDADEGVIAALSPGNLRALRHVVGRTPPWVRFVDAADWYSRPPDTMGRWVSFALDQLAVGRPGVRIVGEVFWPDDPLLHGEMRRFESAATLAFDALPTLVVCPYDKSRHPSSVIEAALATHPGVIEDGVASLSPTHISPEVNAQRVMSELYPPEGETERRFEPFDVAALAAFVEGRARRARLDERRVQQLVAAACELAANAFTHVGSPVYVTTWMEDGHLVCQVEDEGRGIGDPGVGYQPPYAGDERWGLWLARRWSDLLEVGRTERGNVMRLRAMRDLSRAG